MFDFEKLNVYQKAKEFNAATWEYLKMTQMDRSNADQLSRATHLQM